MAMDEMRRRYEVLRERRWPDGLTDAEQAELAALTRELCERQDAAMAAANERALQRIAALEAEAARLEAQNRQLRECLREWQDLLTRARSQGAEIRAEARQLRARFASVLAPIIGSPTGEPF
jgi:chromosome segregation ATPase